MGWTAHPLLSMSPAPPGLCRDDVPVVIVMKAMGVESDQEAASLVGPESDFGALFLPSLEAAADAAVVTQQQALQWLGAHPLVETAPGRLDSECPP